MAKKQKKEPEQKREPELNRSEILQLTIEALKFLLIPIAIACIIGIIILVLLN